MAKRRLSKQQLHRIRQHQQAKRQQATDPAFADDLPVLPARVISQQGRSLVVERLDDDHQGELVHCRVRQNLGAIVCNDRIHWQAVAGHADDKQGVVVSVEPRRNLLVRPHRFHGEKPVAANLDQILIVCALRPPASLELIDRYLVMIERQQLKAVVVCNKQDLLDRRDSDSAQADLIDGLAHYQTLGYIVVYASVKQPHGLNDLRQHLSDRVSLLVGQSGVGKSSLVKALLPDRQVRIGQLSQARHGRHTTSQSVLYPLCGGGSLIDSPGVRDFGLWHLTAREVEQGFVEFVPLLGQCKFSDCTHEHEPGCAIMAAVQDGRISERRWQSYLSIRQSVESSVTS